MFNNHYKIVFFIILLTSVCSIAQKNVSFIHGFPDNFTSDAAIDVQYSSCKIITDRLVATAEGKFSRFCNGICNISETNARLHRIESLLTTNAEMIKQQLFQIERILFDDRIKRKARPASDGVSSGDNDSRRLKEIGSYNGTVFTEDGPEPRHTVFVYYWRVDGWRQLASLAADGRAAVARSSPFYVSPRGYRITLVVRSDVAARTVTVAAMPVAGEYDAQLRWPMVNRLRLSVLDQTDAAPEDIVSRVWDDVRCGGDRISGGGGGQREWSETATICASLEFRHDVLNRRRYTVDDSLIVKLTVFL